MFSKYHDITTRPTQQATGDVPIAQIDWEVNQVVEEVKKIAPQTILEIGSQHGGSLRYWMSAAARGAHIISIDKGSHTWVPPQEFDNTFWYGWAKSTRVGLQIIQGDSHDLQVLAKASKQCSNGVDFLFLDGDHSYEGTKLDFDLYGKLVNKGGIIALHDIVSPSFSPHIQVEKLWREIQAAGYKTREFIAGAGWGGIGLVYL